MNNPDLKDESQDDLRKLQEENAHIQNRLDEMTLQNQLLRKKLDEKTFWMEDSMTESAKFQLLNQWLQDIENFSFATKIQPIIDQKCLSCHDGQPANGRTHGVVLGRRPFSQYHLQPVSGRYLSCA